MNFLKVAVDEEKEGFKTREQRAKEENDYSYDISCLKYLFVVKRKTIYYLVVQS